MLCKQYYNFRKELKDGDILVYHKINLFTENEISDSLYCHAGIVKWINDRVFTLEIWNNQIILFPLSIRMKDFNSFYLARIKNKSLDEINNSIGEIIQKVDNETFLSPIKNILINIYRLTGINLFGAKSTIESISSEFVKTFTNKLKIKSYQQIKKIKPKDFIINANDDEIETIFEIK